MLRYKPQLQSLMLLYKPALKPCFVQLQSLMLRLETLQNYIFFS
jgi:hypothetical protein